MKFRAVGSQLADCEVRHAVVVADDYHRRVVGLEALSDDCVIVESPREAIHVLDSQQEITLIETRPEVLLEHLRFLLGAGEMIRGIQIGIVFPRWNLMGTLELLDRADSTAVLAVVNLSFDKVRAYAVLREAYETDRPLSDFLAGYRVAVTELGELPPAEPPNCDQCLELKAKHLSLIGAVEEMIDHVAVGSADNVADLPDQDRYLELERNLNAATGKLTQIVAERDSLKRKYESLANSILGGAALKYWSWRRKGKRSGQ